MSQVHNLDEGSNSLDSGSERENDIGDEAEEIDDMFENNEYDSELESWKSYSSEDDGDDQIDQGE